jgi:hypothetical protein
MGAGRVRWVWPDGMAAARRRAPPGQAASGGRSGGMVDRSTPGGVNPVSTSTLYHPARVRVGIRRRAGTRRAAAGRGGGRPALARVGAGKAESGAARAHAAPSARCLRVPSRHFASPLRPAPARELDPGTAARGAAPITRLGGNPCWGADCSSWRRLGRIGPPDGGSESPQSNRI